MPSSVLFLYLVPTFISTSSGWSITYEEVASTNVSNVPNVALLIYSKTAFGLLVLYESTLLPSESVSFVIFSLDHCAYVFRPPYDPPPSPWVNPLTVIPVVPFSVLSAPYTLKNVSETAPKAGTILKKPFTFPVIVSTPFIMKECPESILFSSPLSTVPDPPAPYVYKIVLDSFPLGIPGILLDSG